MTAQTSEFPAKPIGIAVVGCGRIAPYHIKGAMLHPDHATLVAVVDPNLAHAQEFAATYGAPHACATLEEVLALEEVEAVILCTPNAMHAAQTEQVLNAGRHVLVEKPFAENLPDATRIAALAESKNLTLAAGHTFRHVEAVRTLQDKMPSLGRLRAVSISMCVFWDGPQAPWWASRTRDEGLILSLFAPHAIDFLQLVVGAVDPVKLHVEVAQHQSGWQAEDEAMILARYPNDVLASIHVSYNQKAMVNRKVAHFEHGTLRVENGDELWIDEKPVIIPERPETTEEGNFTDGMTHYFACQLREFARAVRGLPNRSVLHDEAVRQTRLNQAILKLANQG